jgi:hypothetical protein
LFEILLALHSNFLPTNPIKYPTDVVELKEATDTEYREAEITHCAEAIEYGFTEEIASTDPILRHPEMLIAVIVLGLHVQQVDPEVDALVASLETEFNAHPLVVSHRNDKRQE